MERKKYTTVFGATGRIGKVLLRLLSEEGIPTIAITRDLNKAIRMPNIDWIEADMGDKESLQAPLKDARAVFLASGMSDQIVREQTNVIEAAKTAGVEFIVKLSSGMADKNSPLYIARVHGEIEENLKGSDIPSAILRPNGFMQNWLGDLAQTVKTERKIYEATGDGKRPYIDLRDIAEVAFRVLTHPSDHSFHTYQLTGDEAVNYLQVADVLSAAIGERVTFVPISPQEAQLRMEKKGMPPGLIHTFLAYTELQRLGKAGLVSSDVRDILKKPARSIEDFAYDYVESFK
ncbi:NmrA family NAD(P)-binding protein [Flavitalea flava]